MYFSWVIFRYFFKKFWFYLFFASAIACTLIFILDITDLLRRSSHLPQISWGILFRIALLKLPYFYTLMLPFIVLFAAIFHLWLHNRKTELTVLKASGVSFRQILLPIICAVYTLAFLDISILNPLSRLLWSRHTSLDARYLQQQDQQFLVSEQGIWMRLVEHNHPRMYRIDRMNRDTGAMQNVTILVFNKQGLRTLKQYHAKDGGLENGRLKLSSVWVVSRDGIPSFYDSLTLTTKLRKKDLEDRYLNPRYLSIWKIMDIIKLMKKSGLNPNEYWLQLQAEFARFFWLASLVLLAGIFMMRPPRETQSLVQAAKTLLAAFALISLKDFLYALGLSGRLPIYLAAWAPVAINYMLTMALLLHYEDG